jgi:hypothetical protein
MIQLGLLVEFPSRHEMAMDRVLETPVVESSGQMGEDSHQTLAPSSSATEFHVITSLIR